MRLLSSRQRTTRGGVAAGEGAGRGGVVGGGGAGRGGVVGGEGAGRGGVAGGEGGGRGGVAADAVGGAGRLAGVRVVALGSAAAISAAALLAASGWLVTRAAEQPPVLALLAAIVVVRALGLVRAFARYGERIAGHDVAFRKLATVRVRWYRRLIASAAELPAADLLSRFVIDVDELQHRDLRVRWPAAVAAIAALATAGLATAIHPPAGLDPRRPDSRSPRPSSPRSPTEPRVASCAVKAKRAPTLVDELVEALDSATELALAGRTQERLDRLDHASNHLTAIARSDAAAAAHRPGPRHARRRRDPDRGPARQHAARARAGSARSPCSRSAPSRRPRRCPRRPCARSA